MKDKIIIPLDFIDLNSVKKIVEKLNGLIDFYKVGSTLFTRFGPKVIEYLKTNKKRVFLDLKYHDIPSQVAGACEAAVDIGVDMLNLHTLGGFEMMEAAVKGVYLRCEQKKIAKPILLGVTILTSIDEASFSDLFGDIKRTLDEQVLFLADLARSAGLDGVVASPQEVKIIKQKLGKEFIVVTPGVRPEGEDIDDHSRLLTPRAAIEAGADYLVIGRPITHAPDPRKAVEKIIASLEKR